MFSFGNSHKKIIFLLSRFRDNLIVKYLTPEDDYSIFSVLYEKESRSYLFITSNQKVFTSSWFYEEVLNLKRNFLWPRGYHNVLFVLEKEEE